MMKFLARLSLVSLLLLMGAHPPMVPQVKLAVEQSRVATQSLLSTLQSTLKGVLATGGPIKALETCQTVAPEIHRQVGLQQHLTIRRVSFKTRNPANTPDDWDSNGLKQFEALRLQGQLKPETELYEVDAKGKTLQYLKPIVVAPLCLQCHGRASDISSMVKSQLKAKYPKDQAVGYQVGDLRGAVSIRVPLKGQ